MNEYDEAFAQMGKAPLELDEAQPTDRRRYNRGTRGNRGVSGAGGKALDIVP